MADSVYRVTEVIGVSGESWEAAARSAVETAAKTLRKLDWFEVVESRGHIVDGKIAHWQVTLKVAFRLEG